jgi:hypothetical protein
MKEKLISKFVEIPTPKINTDTNFDFCIMSTLQSSERLLLVVLSLLRALLSNHKEASKQSKLLPRSFV